ncbi:rab, putative [Schistosoma mansoni]|uniref:rab, putative n=1 Tax=Schistosoma mansoni TaxID=6183 RepID=UPI0001A62651|nr:rab, putative [Schistosoma mansoni]|eukprot:XP_018646089.1 rab, putative [Schistosoma mansoni]
MDSNIVDLEGTNECNNISKRIKIILVGSDENEPISTVGTDLKLYEMRLNNELVKLYIWDTAGTERFRNHMCPSYFRHAEGALVVYDVGCQKSFEELNVWIKMIAQHSGSRLVKVIIGNKNDLPARAVNVQKAEEYAKSINCAYLETSAKTGMNVRQAFITLASLIIEKNAQQLNTIKENNVVLREKSKKQVQCCHR